jgi:hypothetical protein
MSERIYDDFFDSGKDNLVAKTIKNVFWWPTLLGMVFIICISLSG